MREYLIDLLVCPVCHEELDWDIRERRDDRIEAGTARCQECAAEYPIQGGIGLFLTADLRRDDLWEQVDSNLIQHLKQHPEIESRLMNAPVEDVAPADLFFRALVLEERGEFDRAQEIERAANEGIYTAGYRDCARRQIEHVLEQLSGSSEVIVDLASGRCYLVEEVARKLENPIIASDFSPRVLRRNRQFLEYHGLYDQVSLLAFDARRTPFRDRSIKTLTTNLGLPNIEQPKKLLPELRRIGAGSFLAVSHFYGEDDEVNIRALKECGLDPLLVRQSALAYFASAGWRVEIANLCTGSARPTPQGIILKGTGIDAFPVSETELDWCVLIAS